MAHGADRSEFSGAQRFIRPGLGALLAVATTVTGAAASGVSPAADTAAFSSKPQASEPFWKDPDGNPLPFQSDEAIIEFLGNARIESESEIELGVTDPRQVILERDGVRLRAALRDYEETFEGQRFDGVFFSRLRDSYEFDIAAYRLAKLLGVVSVPPVTLRRIGNRQVSLQIWVEGAMMETDRVNEGIAPPEFQRFRQQRQNMRVFDSVVGNVDRNTGNILIDENWKLWLIDHSRAFLREEDPKYLERVQSCSRELFARLQALTLEEAMDAMAPPLSSSEVEYVLRRRDRVVAHIEALIAEKGDEALVLFDDRE